MSTGLIQKMPMLARWIRNIHSLRRNRVPAQLVIQRCWLTPMLQHEDSADKGCRDKMKKEGEYSEMGGRIFAGTDREVVIQESLLSRKGVDQLLAKIKG